MDGWKKTGESSDGWGRVRAASAAALPARTHPLNIKRTEVLRGATRHGPSSGNPRFFFPYERWEDGGWVFFSLSVWELPFFSFPTFLPAPCVCVGNGGEARRGKRTNRGVVGKLRRAFFFPWWGGGGGSRARCVVSSAVVAVCWCLVLERRPVGLRAHPPFLFSCVSPLIPNPCVCVCVCVFCAVAVRVCKKRAEETSASRRREDGSSSSLLFFSVSFFSHSSRRCGPGNTPHPRANKVLLVRRDVHDPHSRCLLLADARYERKQSRNASIDATKKHTKWMTRPWKRSGRAAWPSSWRARAVAAVVP
jgi:hypothetical protein